MMFRIIYPRINIVYATNSITSWCYRCSFEVVSTRLSNYARKYLGVSMPVTYSPDAGTSIYIGDLLNVAHDGLAMSYPNATYWLDTPFVARTGVKYGSLPRKLIVTSHWNFYVAKYLGASPRVIPRAVDDDIADKVFRDVTEGRIQKRFDIVVVVTGSHNAKYKEHELVYYLLKDLGLLSKSFLVCDEPWCHRRLFTMTAEELYTTIAMGRVFLALTDSEGFGLPPAEAMSVGVPVVHFGSPFTSAPYEVYGDSVDMTDYGTPRSGDVDVNDMAEFVFDHTYPAYDNILHFAVPVYDFKLTEANHSPGRYYYKPMSAYDDIVRVVNEALSWAKYEKRDVIEEEQLKLHDHVRKYFYHDRIVKELVRQ